MRSLAVVLLACGLGCGSLMPLHSEEPSIVAGSAYDSCLARCDVLDNNYLAAKTVGMIGSALGTVATTSGAFVDGFVDPQQAHDWSMGLMIAGAAGGIASVAGNWLAGEYAERTSACIAACGGR